MRNNDLLLELIEQERKLCAQPPVGDRWMGLVHALATQVAPSAVPRFNPRPKGVVRPGSASDAVLANLRSRPSSVWVNRQQLIRATKRSQKSVDWALIFLRAAHQIETMGDPRNSRYLRYRATQASDTKPATPFDHASEFRGKHGSVPPTPRSAAAPSSLDRQRDPTTTKPAATATRRTQKGRRT